MLTVLRLLTFWGRCVQTLAFTNHTVMPEALEKWPVAVMQKLLPRHMEIIDKVDSIWKDSLKARPQPHASPISLAARLCAPVTLYQLAGLPSGRAVPQLVRQLTSRHSQVLWPCTGQGAGPD